MSDICFYIDCVNMTDLSCFQCHRPVCFRCERWSHCKFCKELDNAPRNSKTGRLSLTRKRKAAVQTREHVDPVSQPQNIQVNWDEAINTSNESTSDSETDLEVNPTLDRPNTQGRTCNCCNVVIGYLKSHLRKNAACVNFYQEMTGKDTIDNIVKALNERTRNVNRQERRRQDAENGIRRADARRSRRFIECQTNHLKNLMTLLNTPCVFCECLFDKEKGIIRIPDEDEQLGILLEVYPDRENLRHDGSYWRCKNCEKISTKLNRDQSLMDGLRVILEVANINREDATLTMTYRDIEQLHKVFAPKLLGVQVPETNVSENDPNDIQDKYCTAMIPSKLCRLSNDCNIEEEAVHLLVNQSYVETDKLLSGLYIDTDQRMKAAAQQIEENKESIKLCSVSENVVTPSENQHSHDFQMKKIRCTHAYARKLVEENLAKQVFNGSKNLKVDMDLPLCPVGMAYVMLKVAELPVAVKNVVNESGIEVPQEIIPCINQDTGEECDPAECGRQHVSANDYLTHTGVYSRESQIRARFMKSYIDSLVKYVITPLTDHHHLQLQFERNGNIKLVGNVWIKELAPYNESGERLNDQTIIPQHFTEELGMKLLNEIVELEIPFEYDPVSEPTANCIELEQGWIYVREGSLQEMIHTTGRGFKSIWSDQVVESVNVGNPATMKQMFKRRTGQEGQNLEPYRDHLGEHWVPLPTWRVKFCRKPEPVKHIIMCQFVGYYQRPDFRHHDKEALLQQLTENDGVLGVSDIPVITNTEKFPHELQFLPNWILLSDGTILKKKNKPNVILPRGKLDHIGMRVLCEPFESEQELIHELENDVPMPDIGTLQQRLKAVFPMSCFEVTL